MLRKTKLGKRKIGRLGRNDEELGSLLCLLVEVRKAERN